MSSMSFPWIFKEHEIIIDRFYQLRISGALTDEQKKSITTMLFSSDMESKVLAGEMINNLYNQTFKSTEDENK